MAEYVMLHQIHYDPRDATVAPAYALGLLRHTSLDLPTKDECSAAIRSLSNRKIVTIVDSSTRRQIAQYLKTTRGIGPTDGLPLIGELDLTLKGAEIWRAILNAGNKDCPTDYFWHNTGDFIYRRNATILIFYQLEWLIRDIRLGELTAVGPIEEIGVWRRQWWREIPFGYLQRCLPQTT